MKRLYRNLVTPVGNNSPAGNALATITGVLIGVAIMTIGMVL
jgi:hypothetical protein